MYQFFIEIFIKALHVISNQKMNDYLKEIAVLCGIDKNITFHQRKHMFATMITPAFISPKIN